MFLIHENIFFIKQNYCQPFSLKIFTFFSKMLIVFNFQFSFTWCTIFNFFFLSFPFVNKQNICYSFHLNNWAVSSCAKKLSNFPTLFSSRKTFPQWISDLPRSMDRLCKYSRNITQNTKYFFSFFFFRDIYALSIYDFSFTFFLISFRLLLSFSFTSLHTHFFFWALSMLACLGWLEDTWNIFFFFITLTSFQSNQPITLPCTTDRRYFSL